MTQTTPQYKYFAFISYNSHDTAWGKRLQRKLENYRMPATLCSEHGWKRKPINPVFFAPTDIQPGGLTAELQDRLRASRNLIVICSPHSAQSKWVGEEIAYFHSLGRSEKIHFFIVDGTPHSGESSTECFHPIVEQLGLPEILGANIHEKVYSIPWLNRERAYVQLITKLLGVEFDSIWQRHKRLMARNIALFTIGFLLVLAALIGVWRANRPVDVTVHLSDTSFNTNLPEAKNAVVTISLDNETKRDTLPTLADVATFANVPRHALNQPVAITVACRDFMPIDTLIQLKPDMELGLNRDASVYGDIRLRIWSTSKEQAVPNCQVAIEGQTVTSDTNGYISLHIPLDQQKTQYSVTADRPLETNCIPMPCGENDVILVE